MTLELISLVEDYSDVIEVIPGKSYTYRDEWLKERKRGIGGSDAGAICGVDPYRNALDVYLDKTSDSTAEIENPHIKRGRRLEALIAQEYQDRHPEDQINPPLGMMIHATHDWMRGTPDRIIASPRHAKKGLGIMEIKCPAKPAFEKIKLNGIPPAYVLQMQHYLAITGYQWGTFVIFNADQWEMILVDVERDDQLIENLIQVEEKFWNEHVVPGIPPVMPKEPVIKLPPTEGTVKHRDDEKFVKALESYIASQEMVKEAESLQTAAKENLLEIIHQEPGVFETESHRVYYSSQAGRTSFDHKALENVKPLDRTAVALALEEGDWDEARFNLKTGALDLDLAPFKKQGNDFMTLRVFPLKNGGKK